jgi:ketosteroid isomerase-like protein
VLVGAVTAARLPIRPDPRDLTLCQDRRMDAADLVTYRELEELKYRYTRALDHKDWDLFASCFTPDATATYGERLDFTGPDQIVAFMRENLGPNMITLHQVHHPEFTVDGDTATGTWSLMDRVIMTEYRFLLDGASTYQDRYERGADGVWRIAHTGYERIYEQMISFDDVPSFNLTANKFA